MIELFRRWRARLDLWLWGDRDKIPDDIREATRRLMTEAATLDALVSAMQRRTNEPARR